MSVMTATQWQSMNDYAATIIPQYNQTNSHSHFHSPSQSKLIPDLTHTGPFSPPSILSASTHLSIPYDTLLHFFRTLHTAHVRSITHEVRSRAKFHTAAYLADQREGKLVEIARENGFPPYLMAKIVLENCGVLGVVFDIDIMKK